jgi:N-acetylmuramoyl-L-alanine amidase
VAGALCLVAAGPPLGPALDRFRLALDIGHTLSQPGATSATGATEFEYNRTLARAVLAALQKKGIGAAFMIGESGEPMALEARTRRAAEGGADLLLSLHHDSVQPRYLSTWNVGGVEQHYSDLFHGYSILVSARNPHFAESKMFALALGDALLAETLNPSLHHAEPIPGENHPLLDATRGIYEYDGLAVLRTAGMPAVLLESAVIVNRAEEQRVRSGEYHRHVIAAIVKAVRAYCSRT